MPLSIPAIQHHLLSSLSVFYFAYIEFILYTITKNTFLACKSDHATFPFVTCFFFDMMTS